MAEGVRVMADLRGRRGFLAGTAAGAKVVGVVDRPGRKGALVVEEVAVWRSRLAGGRVFLEEEEEEEYERERGISRRRYVSARTDILAFGLLVGRWTEVWWYGDEGGKEGKKEKREGKEDEGGLKKCLLRGLDEYRADVLYSQ